MKPQTANFEFTLPMTDFVIGPVGNDRPVLIGNLTISGDAKFWPESPMPEAIDYNIASIEYNDIDILPVLDWMMSGSAREKDEIHNAIISHLEGIFKPEFEQK